MTPRVSIILPTYNRAAFLPEALASIQAQSLGDWELIVVDDGSTDGTRGIVDSWSRRLAQPISYVWQENRGAYAARNTGLDRATAPLIAFFDSDDLWLAHHLERCVAGFDEAPEVDWIFAACEMVDSAGQLVHDSTFLDRSRRPHEFLFLEHDIRGELRVINDPHAIECLLDSGIYCGLQNSVLRAELFARERFWEDYRVVEDSQFLLRGLVHGIRLAYLTDVHVVYRMHEENSSGSALGVDRRQLRRISEEKIRGLERLKAQLALTPRQRRAMDRNLAREYFWRLGYACCWQGDDRVAALQAMRTALRLTPMNLWMAKTYAACAARAKLGASRAGAC